MNWILATRGAATVLRASPFTETSIEGMHSVLYRPGVDLIAQFSGESFPLGTYARGLHRVTGVVYSWHGRVAEELLGIESAIDLIIRYRAHDGVRRRIIRDVVFGGTASVAFPTLNRGVSTLVGVPFRAQIASGAVLDDAVVDEEDE